MFGSLLDRTIEVNKTTTPEGRPVKTYQYVRPARARSRSQSYHVPQTSIIHHPSPDLKPVKDNFQPPEGEDLAVAPYHAGRGGQTDIFHPLPPIIHQYHPQQQIQQQQQQQQQQFIHQNHDNHNQHQPQLLGDFQPHPHDVNHPHHPNNPNNNQWAHNAPGTLILDNPPDHPHPHRRHHRHHHRQHSKRRPSHDRRLVRVHRSDRPRHRSRSKPRPNHGNHHYYPTTSSSSSTSHPSSPAYYYYPASSSTDTGTTRSSSDSWDRPTVKSEYGLARAGEWSDGGDSWDEGEMVVVKASGKGRRRRDRDRDRDGNRDGELMLLEDRLGRLRVREEWEGGRGHAREGRSRGRIYLK